MHQGTFSELPAPDHATNYERGSWSRSDLDPDPPRVGRRQWMLGVGCLFLGAAVPSAIGLAGTEQEESSAAPGGSAPSSLPDWAREMLEAGEEQLIQKAGLYEMRSAQHGGAELAPCFVHLLRVCATSDHTHRDRAAACAVRTLARIGRIDLVESWMPRLSRDPGLSAAEQAARSELDEDELYRRSRGR